MKPLTTKALLLVTLIYGVSTTQAQASELYKEDPLSVRICGAGYTNWARTDSIGGFEKALLWHLGKPANDPNKEKHITKFFNENNAKLICTDDTDEYIRENEHILKRSLALGEWDFLGHVANSSKYEGFDWNFYEMVDGKKETLLDYLDMIINDEELASEYNWRELRTLYRTLRGNGAKHGHELE